MNIAKYALYILLTAQPALLSAVEVERYRLSDYTMLYKTSNKERNDIFICSLLLLSFQENNESTEMQKINDIMKMDATAVTLNESNQ